MSSNKDDMTFLIGQAFTQIVNTYEIKENLIVYNRTDASRSFLRAIKKELALLACELYYSHLDIGEVAMGGIMIKGQFMYARLALTVDGDKAAFEDARDASKGLEHMLRIIARLEEQQYVRIDLSYEGLNGKLATLIHPHLHFIDEAAPEIRYRALLANRDGDDNRFFMLAEKEGKAEIIPLQQEEDLDLANRFAWWSGFFILGINYPADTDPKLRERMVAVLKHFHKFDPQAECIIEDEYEDILESPMEIEIKLSPFTLEKELLLLNELAALVKSVGGWLDISCDFYPKDTDVYGMLSLRGDVDGCRAKVVVF